MLSSTGFFIWELKLSIEQDAVYITAIIRPPDRHQIILLIHGKLAQIWVSFGSVSQLTKLRKCLKNSSKNTYMIEPFWTQNLVQ